MEGLTTILTVVLGLIVRIAVPLALTIGLIYLLRRLDRRWKKEALSVPVIAAGGKPCWEVKGCSESQRKDCPVATERPSVPCWQFFRSKTGLLREDCLGCTVFRQVPALIAI
jgi:hypothetical protein